MLTSYLMGVLRFSLVMSSSQPGVTGAHQIFKKGAELQRHPPPVELRAPLPSWKEGEHCHSSTAKAEVC